MPATQKWLTGVVALTGLAILAAAELAPHANLAVREKTHTSSVKISCVLWGIQCDAFATRRRLSWRSRGEIVCRGRT